MDEEIQRATFEVLEGMSEACFEQMRPVLFSMLRYIRVIKSQGSASHAEHTEAFQKLDLCCQRLFTYLEELNVYKEAWNPHRH